MMSGQPLSQQPVQADAQMTVVLQAQQWNGVLGALAKAPYEVAAPLIQAIGEQLQQQAGAQAGPQPGATPMPNGSDHPGAS